MPNPHLPRLSLLWPLALASLLLHCKTSSLPPVQPAYYYWQTSFSLSSTQQQYLQDIQSNHLLVKIADIGRDPATGNIQPYTLLELKDTAGTSNCRITQVVFLTNAVFQHITPKEITALARQVAELQYKSPLQDTIARAFQVDCDWTESTREPFFAFLSQLRQQLHPATVLSATIRLHQYKFPQRTGVPPVNRGMLMCYNTGDIDAVSETNSILDLADLKKYLIGAPEQYPLPLDIALPAFSWWLVYRDDELWKILPGDHPQLHNGLVEKGTFVDGHYLRPGDVLRQENISAELLKNAASWVARANLAEDVTLAFFHLDARSHQHYPASLIQAVCHTTDSIRSKK
jgi:hypothetical protein